MTSLQYIQHRHAAVLAHGQPAKALYQELLRTPQSVETRELSEFLKQHLAAAQDLPCDLPADVNDLAVWVTNNAKQVAERYGQYLQERRQGAPRRFFSTKAHALYFLQHVAPTKLVDGAWLYGMLEHADDWRYHGLIRTYLEELGDGDPALNHVVLYRKLLAEHDCAPVEDFADDHYLQGALQLALGHAGDDFLPEAIGFNLGYEQLPLHLLITAFELNELAIDPYYFTLHATIDNASSGHAQKAVEAVLELLPHGAEGEAFLQRVSAGYRLNELGVNTMAVIEAFDLEEEVVQMLERKSSFGQHMHSDYCRLEGRTVNEWLATPGQSRAFLAVLENKGWIKRHQDPQMSRFWQLLDGPGAVMFGVFSGYEMQLLHDWIAGDWQAESVHNPFRSRFRKRSKANPISTLTSSAQTMPMAKLLEHLTPAQHATPVGLQATRIFAQQLGAQGIRP